MKANELRIGNLVYLNDKQKVWEILDGHEIDEINENKTVEPINLIEEWLLKFGFIKNQNVFWISISSIKAEIHIEQYSKEFVTIVRSDFSELILCPVKYVHQLQNLYFALTGKELEVKDAKM